MRTTVEMKTEHRSALLAIAARRGHKGFSSVLTEALEEFLAGQKERKARRDEVLSLAGTLRPDEAKRLRQTTKAIRESWR